MPGLIVVMTGAWLAITVISPSVPGMITSFTDSDRSSRSGDTSSKLKLSAISVTFPNGAGGLSRRRVVA